MATKIAMLKRDPFARETTIRQTVRTDAGCAWCGNDHGGRLYRYGVERDGLRDTTHWDWEVFCGIDCRRAYYR